MLKSLLLLTATLAITPLMAMEGQVPNQTGMDNLPDETKLHILNNLGPKDLATIGRVDKKWNELADDEALWKGLSEGEEIKKEEDQTWKEAYKETIDLNKTLKKLKSELVELKNKALVELRNETNDGNVKLTTIRAGTEDLSNVLNQIKNGISVDQQYYNIKYSLIEYWDRHRGLDDKVQIQFGNGRAFGLQAYELIDSLLRQQDPRVAHLLVTKGVNKPQQLTLMEILAFMHYNQIPLISHQMQDFNYIQPFGKNFTMTTILLSDQLANILRNFVKEYNEMKRLS